MRVLLIGLMITSVDEIIQIAYLNENPSFGNTLLMDFVPFMMMSIMLFLINNNKSVKSVNMADTLVKLEHGTITSKEAYKEMYSTRHQRMYVTNNAHFLRLRIVVPDDKSANKLLGVLFFLPIPLGLVRFAMNFVKEEHLKESPFSREELMNMINSKNINVQVNASDKTKVIIKTI